MCGMEEPLPVFACSPEEARTQAVHFRTMPATATTRAVMSALLSLAQRLGRTT